MWTCDHQNYNFYVLCWGAGEEGEGKNSTRELLYSRKLSGRKLSQIGKKWPFCGENFCGMLKTCHRWVQHAQFSWRILSWVAPKQRNLWIFLPQKLCAIRYLLVILSKSNNIILICVMSLYCRLKEIVGYDPQEFGNHFYDFLHPAEYRDLKALANDLLSTCKSSLRVYWYSIWYLAVTLVPNCLC